MQSPDDLTRPDRMAVAVATDIEHDGSHWSEQADHTPEATGIKEQLFDRILW